jgi:uncharacterized protein (DUF58 family)
MSFTSKDIKKIDYAKLLTACLVNLSIKQRDATGLVLFNNQINTSIPAKSKRIWANQCLTALERARCSGDTDLANVIFTFGERIRKRSLIVIITDFFDDSERINKALSYLKFNKHHCVLLHLVDKAEGEFSFREDSIFIDLETDESLRVSPWVIKKEYIEKQEMFHLKLKEMIEKLGFEYCQISTDTPVAHSLRTFLTNRG